MAVAANELFFIDVSANEGPSTKEGCSLSLPSHGNDAIFLPSHVTIVGDTPVEVIDSPFPESEDVDYINYLEYDQTKGTVRYFHEPDEENALNRQICKNCGAEGRHKTLACPVLICLTCGARDEHSTRSCPISKVCFSCGMKGHINARCPNRGSSKCAPSEKAECDRCSWSSHRSNECPTWWRLYEYTTGDNRDSMIAIRRSKKHLQLSEGGEGYVGDDEWCYNCASPGHWGDDCDALTQLFLTENHSAFSKANVMMGPFDDLITKPQSARSRTRADHQGRNDNRLSIQRASRRGRPGVVAAPQRLTMQTEPDSDDWFSNASLRRDASNQRTKRDRESNKTFTFSKNIGVTQERREPPTLLERMGLQSGETHLQSNRPSSKSDLQNRRIGKSRGDAVRGRRRGVDHAGPSGFRSAPRYEGGYGR